MARIAEAITRRAVGAYDAGSVSCALRARRWHRLTETFPDIGRMTVLDVGGDARSWRLSGIRPAHVILVNVTPQDADEPWMTPMVADACAMPRSVPSVDLVYSNSVIEHVGGHWRRQRFADAIRSAGERYWVQTPYRYFPIEPHFLIPGLQFLPRAAQAEVVRRWPVGNYAAVGERDEALQRVMDIELLTKADMHLYFPDAAVCEERLLGTTKSLIAIKA